MMATLYVGCAGWNLPRGETGRFPAVGSHLERYSARLPAVEINSSFYLPHRPATYARWAASVPAGFRFAVKVPKVITHGQRLENVEVPLRNFLAEAGALEERLGVLLVQLPPSLQFDPVVARGFFETLRDQYAGGVACEPRHASWFGETPDAVLRGLRVARVAADPAPVPAAAEPGGWPGLIYHRLHGSPKTYYSNYEEPFLASLANQLKSTAATTPCWCIFDNMAAGCATANARALLSLSGG